ncbi:hypothetical protein N798_09905 [Knoellia flava TL1]|uniref:HTH cro/C1-type domain-containing protein n=2 Tax=Knoellia flava TaxID=913969 RepID=A0A8H9FVJ3_9MICO|nr:hypothetical protein [Knoellia flava]KGN30960.1 hypothetical protein N798_09905 [Knoellia flava TL1]GGB84139.1 hypothetical protein GCM10011314_24720 [Knoellia flava]
MATTDPRDQQRLLYGAPLSELAATVRSSLGLTQGRLAEVLGLSAPMFSQLVSGQRIKIGNPAVVRRLQLLLDLSSEAAGLTAPELDSRIAAIRDEQPTLTSPTSEDLSTVRVLAASATADQLRDVARAADGAGAGGLGDLLRRAAGAARG